jgi:hypothetical protein
MQQLKPVTADALSTQLNGLAHERTRTSCAATLALLLATGRVEEETAAECVQPSHIAALTDLVSNSSTDGEAAAAAAAVLAGLASLTDDLHAAVDAAAVRDA